MKNKFKFLTFLLAVTFLFISSSCSDDDDDNALSFSSSSLNLIVNEEQSVDILGGSGDFSITVVYPEPNDSSLIKDSVVSIKQNDRKVIIQGLSAGKAMIVVMDKQLDSQATLLVVVKDPYVEEKKDATARFSWNDITKKSGVDAGDYVFSYADKIGQFKWVGDEKNSITFAFEYKKEIPTKKVKTSPKSFGRLTIVRNGEKTEIDLFKSAIVFQVQSAAEGENNTVWVAFNIDGKDGICVAKFAE